MQCPVDGTVLQISERQGVEIDYCPQCRGVWLDRGELDKIVERYGPSDDDYRRSRPSEYRGRDDDYDERHRYKRKSFLGGLFGGDDD